MNNSTHAVNSSDLYDDYNGTGPQVHEATWNASRSNWTLCQDNSSACDWAVRSAPPASKVYWALVMIPLPLVAVVGNILVILSVYKERNLQSATNYFIVSLAFADLLVAAVVMPFAVYVLVNVDWELSDTLCDFYIALDVTCSTASIFNLVAISVDRFIAVTKPIQYSKHKNGARVLLTIVSVWLVSAAIGSPIVLGLNTSPERQPNLCVFYNSDFIIYSSLSSFYIPCLVMVYLYYRIFRAIHERARKAIGNKAPARSKRQEERVLVIENATRADHEVANSDPKRHPPGKPGQSAPYVKTLTPLIEGDEASQMCPSDNVDDDEDDEESPTGDCHVIGNSSATTTTTEGGGASRTAAGRPCFRANGSAVAPAAKGRGAGFLFRIGRPAKKAKRKREKNAAKRERKATKTLAIVLGVFLICWVPFFTCNILDAICIKLQSDTWRPGVTVFLLTTWLGYINSCVNPVIYTIFNLEFRKAFKKLLLEPCK